MEPNWRRRLGVVLLGSAFEGGLAVLAWLLGWLLGEPPLAHFTWSVPAALLGVVATLPMLFLFFLLVRFPVGPLHSIRQFLYDVVRPLFHSCTLLELALLALCAGFGEELLFRGVLQPVFSHWLSPLLGVVLASALFGLVHPITTTYVVLAAGLGMYLGIVAMASDNVLVVIVAHALYDWLVLVWLMKGPAGESELGASAT